MYYYRLGYFDAKQLYDLGIEFIDAHDTPLFLEGLNRDLDLRVNNEITKSLSAEDLMEVDSLSNPVDTRLWMEERGINQALIIRNEKFKLKKELVKHREKIPGVQKNESLTRLAYLVENMDLGVRSHNSLLRAGIYTVGEVIAAGDLSVIPHIGERNIREINRAVDVIIAR